MPVGPRLGTTMASGGHGWARTLIDRKGLARQWMPAGPRLGPTMASGGRETLRLGGTRGSPEPSDYMLLTGGYIAPGLGEAGRDVAHPGRESVIPGPTWP